MKKRNIRLELKKHTPVRLLELASNVAAKLENNPSFPAPPVPAVELRALINRLTLSITEATDGTRLDKQKRNDLVVVVQEALRRLADYVRMIAQGDATTLISSGFELAAESSAPIPMMSPANLTCRMTGRHSEVALRWEAVRNRRSYVLYMCEKDPAEGEGQWTLMGVTGKVTHSIQGLVPYKPYWFRVSAVGALGEGLLCAPVLGRAA